MVRVRPGRSEVSLGSHQAKECVLNTMVRSEGSLSERLLVQEITHRVNNEFASAIQIVSSTAARSSSNDVKNALAGVMEQLHSYAKVHHALQMPAHNDSIDGSEYLRELCRSISCAKLKKSGIELVFVEQPFLVSAERGWMMGMIVAELITNAVRHAFDRREGTIRVECLASREFVVCRVSDNGMGSVAQTRNGNGMKIVRGLVEALGATFSLHLSDTGAEAVLKLPLELASFLSARA
jgi:two-component sensor histidine kinase